MLKSKKIALASIITIFLLGLVIGIGADRYVLLRLSHDRHRHGRNNLVQMFNKELNLTIEQQEKLKELLKELRENHDKIRQSNRPEYKRITKEFEDKFSRILDVSQKKKFNEINERFRKKRKKNE